MALRWRKSVPFRGGDSCRGMQLLNPRAARRMSTTPGFARTSTPLAILRPDHEPRTSRGWNNRCASRLSAGSMTDRLEQVEIRIAFLEQANGELSDVVYKLRQELEALRAEFATLTQRWEASQAAPTAYTAEQEKPPHY